MALMLTIWPYLLKLEFLDPALTASRNRKAPSLALSENTQD
jgi:hypothetical protein